MMRRNTLEQMKRMMIWFLKKNGYRDLDNLKRIINKQKYNYRYRKYIKS